MRRRKVKGADEKLLTYSDYVLHENIEAFKGKWSELFKNNNPIHVEFGTGRGKFLTTLAKNNPNINYIAFEIKEEVIIKGVEKAYDEKLDNILFAWTNVINILDYFNENEVDRVYVNFCDPWPKSRWSKRRLTHKNFLDKYENILNDNGEIHFKTDNEKLFEFSLNEIASCGWMLKNISLNLTESDFDNVTTEYEDKFINQGLKIFRLEAKK